MCERIDDCAPLPFTQSMRLAFLTTVFAALLLGCKNPATDGRTVRTPVKVIPVNPIQGKVVLLKTDLNYVIIDFSLGRLPSPEQKLNVYRGGQKVGQVRISGQSVSVNFAADIVAGEAKVGDEVKED